MFCLYASNVMIATMILTSVLFAISMIANWPNKRIWIILLIAEFALFITFSLIYDSQSGKLIDKTANTISAIKRSC